MLEADVEVDRRDFAVCASLSVAPGERLALFGPSGAGKTTVLEAIAGLVAPRRGRISLAGRLLTVTGKPAVAVPPWQRRVGLLRQDPGLFPHLSVRDNLRYARSASAGSASAGSASAGSASARAAEVTDLATALELDGLLDVMPARLSGGQAHRVALGRLLLAHCEALLLDEPYTGLDHSLRRSLTDLVTSLVGQRRVPAILVAHELAEAQAFADRLAVIDRGALLQSGPPAQVVLEPASRRVAELVGYTAFVPVAGSAARPVRGSGSGTAGRGERGGQVLAGIHPDRVTSGSHPASGLVLAGAVSACRPAGARWEITIRTAGTEVTGRLAEPAAVGQDIALTATDPPCFGPDGQAVARAWQPGDGQEESGSPARSALRQARR